LGRAGAAAQKQVQRVRRGEVKAFRGSIHGACGVEIAGLKPGERIAGFIYIGHNDVALEERPRPDMEKIVTRF
ncbi:MAG TPA: hypothetical protein VIJ72_04610, partial [Rhizomicrobium sp.]